MLCLVVALGTTAQLPTLPGYIVQTFGAANGLPSSDVVSLYQDTDDFIWVGTRDGISRYDGYRFQNFEYVNDERIGTVHCITEDNEGKLWIGTETGLYYWSEKAFHRLQFQNESSFYPFYTIHFAENGQVWIGTLKGPLLMNNLAGSRGQPIETFLLPGWEAATKKDGLAKFISVSKQGVAIGGFAEVYLYKNNQILALPNPHAEREYLRGVLIDEAGTVCWNNVLTGFHFWNGKETVKPTKSYGHFFDLLKKDDEIFLYSNAAIMKVDSRTGNRTTLVNLEPLTLRSPSCLMIDREGSFWLGATEGLFRVKKNPFTVHWKQKLEQSDEIYSLLRRKNGELLLGANRGRIFLMKDTMQFYKNLKVVPTAEVFSMYEDEENALWFGTGYQGIARYKNGELKSFNKKNGLPDNSHFFFYKTRSGQLWSAGDMGLTRIDRIREDSFRFVPFFYHTPGDYHKLYGMAEAPDGSLWAGGWLGLFQVLKDSLHLYVLPEFTDRKVFVTSFRQNKQGQVWMTTRGHGILLCEFRNDNKLHLQKQFRTEDGLLTNTYLSVAFDREGNAWAGNHYGVTAILPSASRYSIKNFDVKDGFIAKNYQSLNMFADGSTMWALTSSGAVSFEPKQLLQTSRRARLSITQIDLFHTKRTADEFLQSDNKKMLYEFPHNYNSFGVQFAALYFANPDAVRYYYQLQPVDSRWTSTGREKTILFRELPPGTYTLLVKASIGGSDWTNTDTISFTIAKPWWLQWWTIASALIATAGLAFFLIRRREKQIRAREQQKIAFEKIRSNAFQYQLEIQQVINYFTTSMNKFVTVDDMLWDVARNCISKLAFEDCVIYLVDEERNVLQQKAAWGPKTTEENKIVNPIEIPVGKGIVGTVALTGKAEKINDTSKDPRYIIDDAARSSEITVPIYDGDKVIGVIDSEHSEKDFYTERHLQILTTIASHCGARISTIKAENKSAVAKMEALLNKQKALEASLQSMRLQMNPHFLFNALNSIQQMILSGEDTTATRFLSKFSKLLRTVLTNSAKEEVTLKEEIDLLQLYVELESLRFKDSFRYTIEFDESIDPEDVFVPALLLQPLVENAIWHGLMHKSGQRQLSIRFQDCGENCLLCRIEDNGVGRQASKLNGDAQAHTGKGLSVAMERLKTLNEKNGTANSLQVIDLTTESGEPAGTRINIVLYH
jgi:ligand-binding sensor domain-containing protein/putative methionine-R-sulfoxide reductase with GAF domain